MECIRYTCICASHSRRKVREYARLWIDVSQQEARSKKNAIISVSSMLILSSLNFHKPTKFQQRENLNKTYFFHIIGNDPYWDNCHVFVHPTSDI